MSVGSKAGARRRVLSWPVFGLTLGALITGASVAQAAGPVLPTGGRVAAGQAVIGAPGGGVLTIKQSSSKAILDWSGFSIGAGGKVAFDNGSGATLNRVTGASVSSLDGLLTGTGSVYLINPNGVIVGRGGVVKVGGSFVASTLDTSDASFLAGGPLSFAGASTASVVNLGKVGALGGDVALIAAEVSNAGAISAPQGSAGLLAGYSVLMLRDGSLDQGRFSVLLGGAGTSVINSGLISAADAELRAEGGNVYALAGDTSGVIRATGVKRGGGKVWLVAQGGELDLGGAIDAQGAGGTPGSVETSGGTVKIGSARIDAHGGSWLVDPYDLTIDATAASTIDTALNAGTSVTEQTTASGYSGAGVASASGKGDITVAAPISWNTGAGLTLSAYRNIDINAQVTASGGGALTLVTDNSGAGNGGTLLFNGGSVQFTGVSAGQPTGSLAIGVGTGAQVNYTLVANLTTLAADIAANNSGAYALAGTVDGSNGSASYATSPLASTITTPFAGTLEGLGNEIKNLTINDSTTTYVGLFGQIAQAGSARDLRMTGGSVSGNCLCGQIPSTTQVGALAGESAGGVYSVFSNVAVTGSYTVGGLVGGNSGTIVNSSSGGRVSGEATIGGLVGVNSGSLTDVYATGVVDVYGGPGGGLVGLNSGTISHAYSSSTVSASPVVQDAGGLVGVDEGVLTDVYATGAVKGAGVDSSGTEIFGSSMGGLVGDESGTVLGAYASGAVSGVYNIGGLFGYVSGGKITDVYATGDVKGHQGVGGLAGFIGRGTVANAYATGIVAGDSEVGGFAGGHSGGTITDAFYDVVTTGQSNDAAGALGLTTAQFMNASSPISGLALGTTPGGSGFVIVDSDGTLNGSNGATRPILLSEYATTITNAHQMQLMSLNLAASYTVVSDIDASGTAKASDIWSSAGFAPLGATQNMPFSGALDGRGHSITGLSINRPETDYVGLVGVLRGQVSGVRLLNAGIIGEDSVGALIGLNYGTAFDVETSGTVVGRDYVGGLVGDSYTSLTNASSAASVSGSTQVGGLLGVTLGGTTDSYASGAVTGNEAGGLVGANYGVIQNAYATGAVSGPGYVGGIAGVNQTVGGLPTATVETSYASGDVTGSGGAGGLVGWNSGGNVVSSYWDVATTHQTTPVGSGAGSGSVTNLAGTGGSTGLSSYAQSTYANLDFSASGPWVIFDGATRPILKSEYSTTITNAHQLQLMALNLTADYILASDIDASGTTNPSDVWSPAGFIPVGAAISNGGVPYSGVFDGAGHTVSGLSIVRPTSGYVGLFGDVGASGVLQNVALTGGSVTGADYVGALAGQNDGLVRNASAAGPVSGVDYTGKGADGYEVGGLVGINTGTIDNASASGSVTGYGNVGGLVGGNEADPGLALIENSHATGDVLEQGGYNGGGLVGQSATSNLLTPSLINTYATGRVTGTGDVGGLAGDVNSGLVQASYAAGAVSATAASLSASPNYGQGLNVGGLIGYIGHIQATTILDDNASGAVTGVANVGGLVGGMRAPTASYPAAVTIDGGYASGAVSGASLVGGLIGYNEASVTRSDASGAVSGSVGTATELGGLVGENIGTLANSGASGPVQGDAEVGGLVGINNGTIANSYASGSVTAGLGKTAIRSGQIVGGLVGLNSGSVTESYVTGASSGDQIVGGLVGFDSGTISNSYALGKVDGVSGKTTPSGSGTLIGGLVGESIGNVSNSYATGAVTGTGDIGGLIGFNGSSASVVSSYATGRVTDSSGKASKAGGLVGENYGLLSQNYAVGPVSAFSEIGGLVGYNGGQIADTYASGAVRGSSGKGALVGVNDQHGTVSTSYATGKGGAGFAGTNNGALSNDYFDESATGTSTGIGSGSNAGVTAIGGSSGPDPHQASSYAGFDFANTWTIQAGASRPYLQAVPQSPPPT